MIGKLLAEVKIGELPLNKDNNISKYGSVSALITIFIKNAFTLAGIILVILLIFGGFNFIIAAGNDDPKKTQQAANTIKAALIGFAIVFLSYVIVQAIETFTGLKILNSGL